jgi:hypothetical protein
MSIRQLAVYTTMPSSGCWSNFTEANSFAGVTRLERSTPSRSKSCTSRCSAFRCATRLSTSIGFPVLDNSCWLNYKTFDTCSLAVAIASSRRARWASNYRGRVFGGNSTSNCTGRLLGGGIIGLLQSNGSANLRSCVNLGVRSRT